MKMTIGIVVLGLIAMVNQDFAGFLGVSIVCTLGAGLLIWLPIAWMIGAAILAIFMPSEEKGGNEQLTLGEMMQFEFTALNNFYTDAKAKGISTEEIQKKLIEAGWTEEQVKPFIMKVDPTAYKF